VKKQRIFKPIEEVVLTHNSSTEMIFFSYLTDFSYENFFPKITGYCQNRSKWDILKGGGVDGDSYFSFIFSYFIFYSESSLHLDYISTFLYVWMIKSRLHTLCLLCSYLHHVSENKQDLWLFSSVFDSH
jgi:hypothetical protein